MARKSSASVRVDPNVRCQRIYPVEGTKRNIEDLQNVGFKLSRHQAIHLARVLLTVSQEWEEIDITGYRFERRKRDDTHQITVTSSHVSASSGNGSGHETQANHALQRTRPSRHGCNPSLPRAGSLSFCR